MSVVDFINSLSYFGDDDDEEEFEDEFDEVVETPKKKAAKVDDDFTEAKPKPSRVSKPSSLNKTRKVGSNGMEVCVIKPTSVDDSREITDTLLGNRTVVLNLEGLDVDIAQRIIDFSSGSTYAIGGNLQKISHYIFILTPPSVDVSGDFNELLGGSIDVGSADTGL
ncbi:MAG: cell division protein SepF [Lachnospiraceae bacterium]|nr:cell division protein SepF [Lachnospiraceae bacterium]